VVSEYCLLKNTKSSRFTVSLLETVNGLFSQTKEIGEANVILDVK